jgi:hypothetical protein
MEMEGSVLRNTEWGDMEVAYNSVAKEFDVTPLLKGLQNDMCQSPHWGYIFKGSIKMITKDGEEIFNAGDIYYMPPGHSAIIGVGTEFIEFSPKEKQKITNEAIKRNLEAMQK